MTFRNSSDGSLTTAARLLSEPVVRDMEISAMDADLCSACPWCDKPFKARKVGGHRKRFCSPSCKNGFHRALRKWAQWAIDNGQVTVTELKACVPSCTTRAGPFGW